MLRQAQVSLLALVTGGALGCGPTFFEDSSEGADAGPGGSGTGTPPPPSTGCEENVELTFEVEAFPPDLLVVLDRSASMGQPMTPGEFDQKWLAIKDALDDIIETYVQRVYFGLMLVPSDPGYTCDDPGVVNIAPSINSNKNYREYLDAESPGGSSPVADSMVNAKSYFNTHAVNPNGRYVLFVTDGIPNCGYSSPTEAEADTRDAINKLRLAGIKTYVLGVAIQSSESTILNSFAQSGGTGSYFPATSSYDLIQSLEEITSEVSVVKCDYQLERGPNDPLDLVVEIGGSPVPYSPEHSNGWDYDVVTRKLVFYGDACEALRDETGSVGFTANYCNDVD